MTARTEVRHACRMIIFLHILNIPSHVGVLANIPARYVFVSYISSHRARWLCGIGTIEYQAPVRSFVVMQRRDEVMFKDTNNSLEHEARKPTSHGPLTSPNSLATTGD